MSTKKFVKQKFFFKKSSTVIFLKGSFAEAKPSEELFSRGYFPGHRYNIIAQFLSQGLYILIAALFP